MFKKLYISIAVVFVGLFQLSAQVNKVALDKYIGEAVENYDLAGLAISVVQKDEVVYKNAFGFANKDEELKLETDAIFGIASLSKAFTAASIGMLVDEGKLDWNDRVSKYIDGFDLNDEYVASQLTVEDIMAHRSGFDTFDGDLLWYGTDYSRDEIIKRFAKYPMTYDFRTEYGYQNIMFILAGELIEQVSGMSWDKFVETRIFKPLGMNHSYTSINQFPNDANVAKPHVKGELDELRNYDNSGGAAAIIQLLKT